MPFTTEQVRAEQLVAKEVERQNEMWGSTNERADVSNGELMRAAMSQLIAVGARQEGHADAFDRIPGIYPKGWSGFRSYGPDVPNLVVAAAFLLQEISRKIRAGESTIRLPRNPETQPYEATQEAGLPNEVKA